MGHRHINRCREGLERLLECGNMGSLKSVVVREILRRKIMECEGREEVLRTWEERGVESIFK